MPELPEVEAVARAVRPLVCGRTIQRCAVIHPIAVQPQSASGLRRRLGRRRVGAVERRGKYLLLRLDQGCVVLHLRLDGKLLWFPRREMRRGKTKAHVDVALEFAHGTLGFVDRRHLGRVQWFRRAEDVAGIRTLGVEPLSPEFTASRLSALLGASRRPVKLSLMDQTRIAGLGNIYANEALWRAGLDPRRSCQGVKSSDARRLHKAVVAVLRRALQCCLDPAPNFRDPKWWFQGLEKILHVYRREGQQCHWCRAKIQRIEQGGRSSFFCARCQR